MRAEEFQTVDRLRPEPWMGNFKPWLPGGFHTRGGKRLACEHPCYDSVPGRTLVTPATTGRAASTCGHRRGRAHP